MKPSVIISTTNRSNNTSLVVPDKSGQLFSQQDQENEFPAEFTNLSAKRDY